MQDPHSLYNRDRARYFAGLERGPGRKLVIGHFNIRRWDHLAGATRVTLLRHPLDRLISHYFFWKRQAPDPRNALWVELVEKDRDLLWFASQNVVRFIYSDGYFAGVDMTGFDLIIVHERLDAGLARLSAMIGQKIVLEKTNATEAVAPDYPTLKAQILADAALTARLRELLAEDIALYETSVRLPCAA